MRCCWLLATVLVIGPICLRDVAAEEPIANVLRTSGGTRANGNDETQATLACAFGRRAGAASSPTCIPHCPNGCRPACANCSPGQAIALCMPEPTSDEKSLDVLAARLVSHSEAATEKVAILSEEAPEPSE